MSIHLTLIFALIAALVPSGSALAQPKRIVSLSVCSDQYVMLLADREKIAAISRASRYPEYSPFSDTAASLPTHDGRLEEILMLRPDLVISGAYARASLITSVRTLGIPVVQLSAESSLATVATNIRTIAKAVGAVERGEALLSRFEAHLADTARAIVAAAPVAAVYRPGGDSPGQDTIVESVMQHVGLRNLASELGVRFDGDLPVEMLILNRPDYLIIDSRSPNTPSLGQSILDHPGLAKILRLTGRIDIPLNLWLCAGPQSASAADLLLARLSGAAHQTRKGNSPNE